MPSAPVVGGISFRDAMNTKRLSFWEIWNMSFGFLGIQFGFALQGGNMSRIFQTLGASKDDIPLLWIAAPLTGLIVQPIIGHLSDRTWHPRWGRRRPYFLIGAVLSSLVLFFVPYSSALWMAAGFLWVLDASINISMEPFRALVADKLPEEQRSYGFVLQTLIIGIGTWVASNLPWFVTKLGVANEAGVGEIPASVYVSFAIGAFVFLTSILITVFTTQEDPPADMEAFLREKEESRGIGAGLGEILGFIREMPPVMAKLGAVQFFSWFAFFTMWSFATPALTEFVFGAPLPMEGVEGYVEKSAAFNEAANSVSSAMGVYGLSSMVFALVLSVWTSRRGLNRRWTHLVSLILGGVGFLSMSWWTPETAGNLTWSFALIGLAWGSILSMPYAMLSGAIAPDRMGVGMGVFNMFIVIPQITAALGGINWAYKTFLGEDVIQTMVLAGISLCVAGTLNLIIREGDMRRGV
jgi:maltose/moltooligosaccharide transporter